jgi:AraC family transcriptional activator of tynA and feaB
VEAINAMVGTVARSRLAAPGTQHSIQNERGEWLAVDLARPDGEVQTGRLGALRFARIRYRGAVDRLLAGDPGEALAGYMLVVQLEGRGALSQYGQHAGLEPGDMVLLDNGAPHRQCLEPGSSLLLLRVPARALRPHLPSPDQFCGWRLSAGHAMTDVAASLARRFCDQTHAQLPATAQDCLARQLLEAVALAFTLEHGQLIASSSVVGGRYARARLYIEQNLGDPELGPPLVARALNVSARYLRMIFAREGECISSYMLRRRLEETARQLADPRWRGRSICEIAFNWGFNSAPHFSRSFRDHYGIPPREYRARRAVPNGHTESDSLAAAV